MKILYIIKNEEGLTESFKKLINEQSLDGNTVKMVKLYENKIDYDTLINEIFEYDKVISL